MNENVNFLFELAVNPGRFEDFKALMPELVEANRKEVGMLTQEWAISEIDRSATSMSASRTPPLS